jgi:hypothetical protein
MIAPPNPLINFFMFVLTLLFVLTNRAFYIATGMPPAAERKCLISAG